MIETGCETFDKWCRLNNCTAMPAPPAIVARFVADISATGIQKIWPLVGEISRAHYLIGLADPTLGGAVSAAINAIANIDPPRSWPAPLKLRFQTLPYDLQAYLAAHEVERDREVRRAQNAAAHARQQLSIQKPEVTDGAKAAVA